MKKAFLCTMPILVLTFYFCRQEDPLQADVEKALLEATRYMVEEISTQGGYLWFYLPEEDHRNAIFRGMDFYLISQHPSGGWAQQYDRDLNPAGARSYEPLALVWLEQDRLPE